MQDRLQELFKCQNSFSYFAKTYILINHPCKGLVPLVMYPYQDRVAEEWNNHRFTLTVKFRQGGFTTLGLAWSLWKCMFFQKQDIVHIDVSAKSAIHIGKLAKQIIQNFPEWLRPKTRTHTETLIDFSFTDSKLNFISSEAVRGRCITHLFINEAAFISKMEEKWASMFPCLTNNGCCHVISTTNGVGNWFYDMWDKANKRCNSFHLIKTDYMEHPDFQKEGWTTMVKEQLGEASFCQEVLGQFVLTGELD
jgi:hypothetical protein